MRETVPTQARPILKRIVYGSIWSVLGTGSGRLMNLLAMILAARILGVEAFGVFTLLQATMGLFGMFAGAALGAAATRFISATRRTDPARTGRIIGLVNASGIVSAVLLGAVIVAVSPWIAPAIAGSADNILPVLLGALMVGCGVFRGIQDAILSGFEAFRKLAVLRFMEGGVTLILIPVLIYKFGLAGAVAALTLGFLLTFLCGLVFVKRELLDHGVTVCWRGATTEWLLLRDFSAPSLLASMVATPVLWVCLLMLSKTPNGFAELGVYNAAYQWYGPLVFVPMSITSVSLPVLTQSWADSDSLVFRRTLLRILAFGVLFSLFPALVVISSSSFIIGFYGEGFETGRMVLIMLALAAPLHVASQIAISAIQSMDRSWYLPVSNTVFGLVLIAVSWISVASWGALGLAGAFFLAYASLLVLIMSIIYILRN